MAITIDQFLSDLTERRFLSGEQALAFRAELTASSSDSSKHGTALEEVAQPEACPLVLCDCLIQESLDQQDNRLTFAAHKLEDRTSVVIHLLGGNQFAAEPRTHGMPTSGKEADSPRIAITEAVAKGDLICVCCESREADTLADVVRNDGELPVELATEILFEAAQSLQELDRVDVRLTCLAPEMWLLDDDGQVAIDGGTPEYLCHPVSCDCEDAPTWETIQSSLAGLYQFLVTGDSAVSGDLFSADQKVVVNRLLGEQLPHYSDWEEMLADLEALRDGIAIRVPDCPEETISEPPVSEMAKPEVTKPASQSETSASQPAASVPGKSYRGVLLAAVMVGIAAAAFFFFNR